MGNYEQTYESALNILEQKILNDPKLTKVCSFLHSLMQESQVEAQRYTDYHQTKCPLEMAWSAFTGKVAGRPEISHLSKYILKIKKESWYEALGHGEDQENITTPIPAYLDDNTTKL